MTQSISGKSAAIQWPSTLSVFWHILTLVVMSQLVMWLDQARGMAYVLLPVLLASSLLRNANLTWKYHFKVIVALWLAAAAWISVGFLLLAHIISIEAGDPMQSAGLLYEIAKYLASDKQLTP